MDILTFTIVQQSGTATIRLFHDHAQKEGELIYSIDSCINEMVEFNYGESILGNCLSDIESKYGNINAIVLRSKDELPLFCGVVDDSVRLLIE